MSQLPWPILDYINIFTQQTRYPAYLLADYDGTACQWGGWLEWYGISGLTPGVSVDSTIYWLMGCWPTDRKPVILPCVETQSGRFADVHIFSDSEGYWVLLLDVTADESKSRRLQQKGNDLNLLRSRHSQELDLNYAKVDERLAPESILKVDAQGQQLAVSILVAKLSLLSKHEDSSQFFTLNSMYLRAFTEPIVQEAGWVVSMFSNSIIAIFGILYSSENYALQAFRAAESMLNTLNSINISSSTAKLHLGIGLTSGTVLTGFVESGRRKVFTAIGAEVDLAQLLAGQAHSQEIFMDRNTFTQLKDPQIQYTPINLHGLGITSEILLINYDK